MIEFTYNPGGLWILLGAVAIGALVFWMYRAAPARTKWRQRLFLLVLRLLTVGVVAVCLMDPQRVEEVRHFPPVQVAVLLDASRSMDVADLDDTRLVWAQRWLKDEFTVPDRSQVSYFGFSSNLFSWNPAEKISANGGQTAMAGALEALFADHRQNSVSSVVLISDGRDNSLKNPEPIARAFARRKTPIHTLTLGFTNEPPDLVLENVQTKPAVPNQSIARVLVKLRSSGFAGRTVPLRILKNGRIIAEKNVLLSGTTQKEEIEFSLQEQGFQTFSAQVPSQPNERLTQNNAREFGLTVADRTVRVIYMEASQVQKGVFQPLYLKHALEDVPGIEIRTLYCEQYGVHPQLHDKVAYVDPRNGDKIFRVQHPTLGFPRAMEELSKFDVIINSDIPRSAFSEQDLKNTERFVTEFGGGFVMVGGHTAFGSGRYNETVVDRIIPVAMELESDITTDTFTPRVPSSAWSHPIMHLGASDTENRAIWGAKFPQLLGYNRVDRAKPGAVALLEHPSTRTRFGPAVILAAQEIGRGRSLAFTSDTTYLWGDLFETLWGEPLDPKRPLSESNCDARYFKQFWANAVRWLAARKTGQDHDSLTHEFERGDEDLEMADLRADSALMANIAAWSGGQVLSESTGQADTLAAVLGGGQEPRIERRKKPLGDTWLWLALIVGLLTVEWVARRLRGLA